MQTEEFQKLKGRLYDQTPILGRKIRHDAVKALEKEASPEAIEALAEALIRSDDSKLQTAAAKTLLTLAAQDRPDAQEALCRLVIEHDHPFARQVVLAAQYVPHDEEQRILFYFLTEQWDAYENADPEQRISKALYLSLHEEIQHRIASCIHRSKRLDWVTILPGERKRQRASEMTDQDWDAALSVIVRLGAWETLWSLLFAAPASWSVRFLLWLRDVQWQSGDEAIHNVLPSFIRLAELCQTQNETPFPYGFTSFHKSLKRGNTGGITCLAMSSDSTMLAGGTEEGVITLWQISDNTTLHNLDNHHGYIMSLAFSPDNSVLSSINEDGTLTTWKLSDGSLTGLMEIFPAAIECGAVRADAKMVAAGTTMKLGVWDVSNGEGTQLFEIQREAVVSSLTFSPDGTMLAEGWDDGIVQIRQIPQGRLVHSLKGHDTEITALAFSPDGQLLASGSSARALADIFYDDPAIQLWQTTDGHALKRLKRHAGTIETLAFSPDGRILASGGGSKDHTVNLWRIPEGSLLQTLKEFLCPVTCLAFSAKGKSLTTGSVEGTVRLWDTTLNDLKRLRVGHTHTQTLEMLQERLREGYMTDIERDWLKFILALAGWSMEHNAILHEIVQIGENDIELHS